MIFTILSKVSGLSKLVSLYGTDLMCDKHRLTNQTIQIGAVKFRRCVTFGADAAGLFLEIKVPLWKTRKLLIPWNDLRQAGYTRIYSESAVRLYVGADDPATLALPVYLFNVMKPFLAENQSK